MAALKNPLTSNAYLNALIQTSKKNDLRLAQEKGLQQQQLRSAAKKAPELSSAKNELLAKLKAKKTKQSVYIPDYGYLNPSDVQNRSLDSVIRDVNAHKILNKAMQQRQELVPKIEYETLNGQQIPKGLLTKDEKEALKKEKQQDPGRGIVAALNELNQQQHIRSEGQQNLLEQIMEKNNSEPLVEAIEQMNRDQNYNNQLQLEHRKLDDLVQLLNPDGKALVYNSIDNFVDGEGRKINMNNPNDVNKIVIRLKDMISRPDFRPYLLQYSEEQRQNEIRQLLKKQYEQSLETQTVHNMQEIAKATGAAPSSPPPATPMVPFLTPQPATPAAAAAAQSPIRSPEKKLITPQGTSEDQWAEQYFEPQIQQILREQGPQNTIHFINDYINRILVLGEYEGHYTEGQAEASKRYLNSVKNHLEAQVPAAAAAAPAPAAATPAAAAAATPAAATPVKQQLFEDIQAEKINYEDYTFDDVRGMSFSEVKEAFEELGIRFPKKKTHIATLKSTLWEKIKELKEE